MPGGEGLGRPRRPEGSETPATKKVLGRRPGERVKNVPVRSCCLDMCLKHLKEARVLRLEGRTGRTGGRIPKV